MAQACEQTSEQRDADPRNRATAAGPQAGGAGSGVKAMLLTSALVCSTIGAAAKAAPHRNPNRFRSSRGGNIGYTQPATLLGLIPAGGSFRVTNRWEVSMAKAAASWMNVDRHLKRCVLHQAACRYAIGKHETPFKGVGRMKRDGGWLGFGSGAEARAYYDRDLQPEGFSLTECANCW